MNIFNQSIEFYKNWYKMSEDLRLENNLFFITFKKCITNDKQELIDTIGVVVDQKLIKSRLTVQIGEVVDNVNKNEN
jgi:hypothetical protein